MRIEYGGYEMGRIEGSIFVADSERIELFDSWNEAMQWIEREGQGRENQTREMEAEDR